MCHVHRLLALFLAFSLAAAPAHGQSWPEKPVRIVVAFAPGGSLDFVARAISDRLSERLGQPVVVENRPGANGNVAADYVARQPGDGYVVLATADALPSSAQVYKLNFDAMNDFTPVIQFTRQPIVLAVHPSTGVDSLAELVALAKKKPGMGYATSGAGSGQHIVGEWLAQLAGIQLTHVPYKGGGQAIVDLVGGQVPLGSLGSSPVLPHYKAGRLKIIAQTTATRAPSLPQVPTYEEAGLKGLVLDQWLGLVAPAGTPAPIVKRLNTEIDKALHQPAIKKRLEEAALEVIGGSQEEFAKLYRSDFEKYRKLVKELNIKIN